MDKVLMDENGTYGASAVLFDGGKSTYATSGVLWDYL